MNFSVGMFFLWWLFINAFYSYAEYTFFTQFAAARKMKVRYLLLYIGISCFFAFIVLSIRLPIFPREFIHAAIMYLFMSCLFKCKRLENVTPLIIIFSLSTFMEGISAVLMRWIVEHITESVFGNIIQIFLSVVLALLFFLILRYVASYNIATAGQTISSYLYVLLLPCTFVVWVVRFGFGLDSMNLATAEFPFSGLPLTWALIAIVGAAATFFVVLKVFENIVKRSEQEIITVLLNNQLHEQKIHLAEAQKRDEQLRSFQHDIDNHLAVISGLLKEGKYSDAVEYFQKLQVSSATLRRHILTGNSVLDVLLREKIGYAEQNHITISYHVCLPPNLLVDDIDLCIIVSNALDNAIQACQDSKQGQPNIEITIKVRHQFLLIEVTNTTQSTTAPTPGMGIRNIRSTAEKYQGITEIGLDKGCFRLSVLLCLVMTDVPPNTEQK